MKLRHSADTDVGKTRDHNEDSFGVGEGEQAERLGDLLVVCDGMGGHAAGEIASKIGVETILSTYYGDPSEDRAHVLEQAFEQANEQIYARGQGSMGTTGVAALLLHDALHVANVGDSRAYLIRDGEIRQISRDHSFVGDQVAAGLITADQARSSPHRNVITRALGYQSGVTIDMFRWPLQIDDIIVLCSDGLHGLVSDAEIVKIAGEAAPDEAVRQLIALANSRGGTDNITVAIAHVEQLDWYGGDQDEQADLHERTTVELPVTGAHAALEPQANVPPPVPIQASPAPALAPAAPAERRLTLLGGLLALVLLAVLVGIIYFAMSVPTVLAPAPATAAPAATTQATSAPTTPAATSAPTATARPTTAATTAATSRPAATAPVARPTSTP
ncbi:MAG TPA: Stp1/IreP family PP2C-type Ser/Thr phosphatase [Roseiflexaceae bacterium]|nr:Stp1/IreP family PP2C-type Ser/Thr phosphatase [Roseiflexaceae bacterium]